MSDELARALRVLELPQTAAAAAQELRGTMSGAGVHLLDLEDGPAVLKATFARAGLTSLQQAQRELDFYRSTASGLRLRIPRLLRSRSTADCVAMLLSRPGRRCSRRWPTRPCRS